MGQSTSQTQSGSVLQARPDSVRVGREPGRLTTSLCNEPWPPPSLPSVVASPPPSGEISKWPSELDGNAFEPSVFNSSDLLRPPLDGGDFKVCHSCLGELRAHRWDSPLEPPAAVDRVTEMGGMGVESWKWMRGVRLGTGEGELDGGGDLRWGLGNGLGKLLGRSRFRGGCSGEGESIRR
ncbi:hypothetical protein GQ457_11G025230 [Hibiscus cannabinus]